jgi:hypothetical protein
MLKVLICLPQIPQIFADIIFVSESSEAKTLSGLEKNLGALCVSLCSLCSYFAASEANFTASECSKA